MAPMRCWRYQYAKQTATNERNYWTFESTIGQFTIHGVSVLRLAVVNKDSLLGRVAVHTFRSDGFHG